MSAEASNYILAVEDAAKRATTLVERLATGDVPAGAIEMPQRCVVGALREHCQTPQNLPAPAQLGARRRPRTLGLHGRARRQSQGRAAGLLPRPQTLCCRRRRPGPCSELRASECAGLVFTSVTKAGAVLSVDVGSGFVLAKVKGPDGAAAWSAPLFFSLLGGGIGMTLGVSNIDSVTVLGSPEALAGFAKDQFELGSDMTAAGPLGKGARGRGRWAGGVRRGVALAV